MNSHATDFCIGVSDGDNQPFIIGCGEVYKLFLSIADKIELTRVHSTFKADAFFPKVDSTQWDLIEEEKHFSSTDQPYDYSYLTYSKKTQ